MGKNKCVKIIFAVLLIANVCATTIFISFFLVQANSKSTKYIMYVGTNDKDTYTQLIPTEDAKAIVGNVCLKYVQGYTLQEAVGVWTDDTQTDTHESTIVCSLDDTDSETVHKIANELLIELNQASILIEENSVNKEFYSLDNAQ